MVETSARVLGPTNSITLNARSGLAFILKDQGYLMESLVLRKEVVIEMGLALGHLDPMTLAAKDNLAVSLTEMGEWSQARRVSMALLGRYGRSLAVW